MTEAVKIEVNFYLPELINSLIKIIKFSSIKEYKWNIQDRLMGMCFER